MLYTKGKYVEYISKKICIGVHPIIDYLKKIDIWRNCKEAKLLIENLKFKKISNIIYKHRRISFINKYNKFVNHHPVWDTKTKVKCDECNHMIKSPFGDFIRRLKQGNNILRCKKCTIKYNQIYYNRKCIISKQQKTIQKLIGGILNFKIHHIYADIAFVDDKIIVEYDSCYWHKNRQYKDRKRDEYLKKLGWKILRIKTRRKIPNKDMLLYELNRLKNNNHKYKQIVLDDWYEI